jgi:elongation factor 1-alpha
MPWFKGRTRDNENSVSNGKTLLDAIVATEPSIEPSNKALRLPIQDVYRIAAIGTIAIGRVESGTLKPGVEVVVAPTNITTHVKAFETRSGSMGEVALPGENVGFSIK